MRAGMTLRTLACCSIIILLSQVVLQLIYMASFHSSFSAVVHAEKKYDVRVRVGADTELSATVDTDNHNTNYFLNDTKKVLVQNDLLDQNAQNIRTVIHTKEEDHDVQQDDHEQQHFTNPVVAQFVERKLNTTDRTKSNIAAKLQLMKVSPSIVEEMKKINISIVISYCEYNLSWIREYIGKEYFIKDITIFSKCGKNITGLWRLEKLSPTVSVINLPNVGRCDHTFAYWIKKHYKFIDQKMKNGRNDIVIFLKDNMRQGRHGIDHVLTQTSKTGFGCITKIGCRCDHCIEEGLHETDQQRREFILRTSKKTYHRLKRDDFNDNVSFVSDKYANLGEWKEDMGFIIPESETIPICYKGLFAVQMKQILNQSEEAWTKMESSLSRGNNIEEGHYAERIWSAVLSDVDNETARAVDEVLSHYSTASLNNHEGCGFKGRVFLKFSP